MGQNKGYYMDKTKDARPNYADEAKLNFPAKSHWRGKLFQHLTYVTFPGGFFSLLKRDFL